eukprot:7350134-Ditylum_brightwellii.AAC.1
MNEVDLDDNEDSISDDEDTAIKDGVFVFYCAMADRDYVSRYGIVLTFILLQIRLVTPTASGLVSS